MMYSLVAIPLEDAGSFLSAVTITWAKARNTSWILRDILYYRQANVLVYVIDSPTENSYNNVRWQRSSVVEQGTHKPLVAGSNPAAATIVFIGSF